MSKHWCLSPEILASIPGYLGKAVFLYVVAAGSVKATVSDLSGMLGSSRKGMSDAVEFLASNGFIAVTGTGYCRTYSIPLSAPMCNLSSHMCNLTTQMCNPRLQMGTEVTDEKPMCNLSSHIAPNSESTAEGHTLLGTLSINTNMAPPSPPLGGRDGALSALKGIWNELFCFLGKEPYGEHLERLVSHWEITQKTTGQYPTKKELAAAFDWVKSKSYQKTVGSILTAFAAIREGEKLSERSEARKPRTQGPAEAPKPASTAAPAEPKYFPIPEGSPWARYKIPVIPNDGSYEFKARAWTPHEQLPGDLVELLWEQDSKNGWRTDCISFYSQAPGLREIALAAGYHGAVGNQGR